LPPLAAQDDSSDEEGVGVKGNARDWSSSPPETPTIESTGEESYSEDTDESRSAQAVESLLEHDPDRADEG